jgi:hypothetical protein
MRVEAHFSNGTVFVNEEVVSFRHIEKNGDGWIILEDKSKAQIWISPHNVLWIEKK